MKLYNALTEKGHCGIMTFKQAHFQLGMPLVYRRTKTVPGYNDKVLAIIRQDTEETMFWLREVYDSNKPS